MKIDLTCPAEMWRYELPKEDYHACNLMMYNLSDKLITSMEVTLILSDKAGEEQARLIYRAHDLHGEPGKTFGLSVPVDQEIVAAKAELVVEKVWFDDNSVWRKGKFPMAEYTPNNLPNSRSLEMLRYAAGPAAVGFPEEQDGLWLCVCGRPNADYADYCIRCHKERKQVFAQYSREVIEKEARLREQQLSLKGKAAREDASRIQLQREQEYKAKKKKRRRVILITALMLMLALLAYVGVFHVLPYVKYQQTIEQMESGSWIQAEAAFAEMGDYLEAPEYVKKCRYLTARDNLASKDETILFAARQSLDALGEYEDAPSLVKEADYLRAGIMMDSQRVDEARAIYVALGDYKESAAQVTFCDYLTACKLLNDKEYDRARAAFEALGDYEDAADKALQAVYLPACEALENGDAYAALARLEQVKDYKDAAELIKKAYYLQGVALRDQGEMEKAGEKFLLADDYEDAAQQANGCIYAPAAAAMSEGKYIQAAELFALIPDYEDAADKRNECLYAQVKACMEDMEYSLALTYLDMLPAEYQDVADLKLECVYQPAEKAFDRKDYQAAIEGFSKIPGYRDADKQLNKSRYRLAESHMDSGDYAAAMDLYELLGDYSESKKQLRIARYKQACLLLEKQELDAAEELFQLANGYKDSEDKLKEISYTRACALLDSGDYAAARPLFEALGKYSDAKKKVNACDYAAAAALMEKGSTEEAISLFEALGAYEDAALKAREGWYAMGSKALDDGKKLQAAAYFLRAGDVQDAAAQAEALYDEYYLGVSDEAKSAMEQGDYALAARLLQEVNLTDLPEKYKHLLDTFHEAAYLEAERLDKAGDPYAALPYYRLIPTYKNVEDRLDRTCYRIMGEWVSYEGESYIFREDGTCVMGEEEGCYLVSTYTMSTGPSLEEMQITHRVSSVNKNNATIYDLRNNTARKIYLTRVEQEAPADQPAQDMEVVDE